MPVPSRTSPADFLRQLQRVGVWLLVLLLLLYLLSIFAFAPVGDNAAPAPEYPVWHAFLFFVVAEVVLFAPDFVWWGVRTGRMAWALMFRLYPQDRVRPVLRTLAAAESKLLAHLLSRPYLRPALGLFAALALLVALPARDYVDLLAVPFLLLLALVRLRWVDGRALFALSILLFILSDALMAVNDRPRGEMATVLLFYSLLSIFLMSIADDAWALVRSLVPKSFVVVRV